MYYILHGEDEFSQAEALARFRVTLFQDDPAMLDLNTTVLDGRSVSMGQLRHVCDTIPFMASERLVIVRGLLDRLSTRRGGQKGTQPESGDAPAWKREYLAELGDYLPSLPPTTRLFFLETRALPSGHPILKLANAEGKEKAYAKLYDLPKEWDLPGWIHRRMRGKGGAISGEAVNMLAELIGGDLRTLDQEIDKLLLYTEGQEITTDDIRALVSRAREISIFHLVDAIGLRQTGRALSLLHKMLEDLEKPLYLLSMIARQIRILIQITELQAKGYGQRDITSELRLHPSVTPKLMNQARNFDKEQLEVAHARLVETDWSIKTGKADDVLALDLLVVELSRN